MANDVMAKLRKLGQQPAKAPPPLEGEAAPKADVSPAAGVTPEPELPKADVSGTLVEVPPGSAPVNPPDAAPNVSPTDPPEPVAEAPVKKKPGRPKKNPVAAPIVSEVAAPATVIDAEFEAVTEPLTKVPALSDEERRRVYAAENPLGLTGQLERDLGEALVAASKQQRFVLAAQLANVLICLKGGA